MQRTHHWRPFRISGTLPEFKVPRAAGLHTAAVRDVAYGGTVIPTLPPPRFKQRYLSLGNWKHRMKLYVGNLSFGTSEQQLRELFEPYGATSASLVMDRDTGRPRGFGFVEIPDAQQANAAISATHGRNFDGRDLTVNEAKPREPRGGGGSYGSRGGRESSGGRGGW